MVKNEDPTGEEGLMVTAVCRRDSLSESEENMAIRRNRESMYDTAIQAPNPQ